MLMPFVESNPVRVRTRTSRLSPTALAVAKSVPVCAIHESYLSPSLELFSTLPRIPPQVGVASCSKNSSV